MKIYRVKGILNDILSILRQMEYLSERLTDEEKEEMKIQARLLLNQAYEHLKGVNYD